jgi:hypothetical protein
MTLDEAFEVAKAVGDCIDPPVIHGIFKSLNEALPDYVFTLFDDGYFSVVEKVTGKLKSASIFG